MAHLLSRRHIPRLRGHQGLLEIVHGKKASRIHASTGKIAPKSVLLSGESEGTAEIFGVEVADRDTLTSTCTYPSVTIYGRGFCSTASIDTEYFRILYTRCAPKWNAPVATKGAFGVIKDIGHYALWRWDERRFASVRKAYNDSGESMMRAIPQVACMFIGGQHAMTAWRSVNLNIFHSAKGTVIMDYIYLSNADLKLSITAMDPFGVRMQFLTLLRKLNVVQQPIQKVVSYALEYFSRCGEDSWDCISEGCQKADHLLASASGRLDQPPIKSQHPQLSLCETSRPAKSHARTDPPTSADSIAVPKSAFYVDLVARDLKKIIEEARIAEFDEH
ncbi:hypothetical protein BJ138DRAFT_1101789 [Hygrophoropsis aurantiaca]|uniref:Uncharacterized protein n=1 Tax=Hygrophoropsis aurantiaca TaxID=72124 RepID=A0ACB8AAN8_9AGAM|nr:hypothetical protein BJ138DRAFT_1101789 [Hygrophoropsis aurantiaca]